MTLLLGPPGCGKTTFLKAVSGNLNKSLKVAGEISYNGYKLDEFVAPKVSAYVSQYDQHIPEMTVRETLDFSARCQGIGNRAEILMELIRREKEASIVPDPQVDTFMKQIPKWWMWFYYMIPTSWSLNMVLTSQYGDVEKEITVFGETKTAAGFLRDYFGFHHSMLPLVTLVLTCYPVLFASLFAYCIGKLNFQRR